MMRIYARVFEGIVYEIFETDLDIQDLFHPEMSWVEVVSGALVPQVGWHAVDENGEWKFQEPEAVAPTEAELKTEALAQRDLLLTLANEATAGMADAYIAGLLSPADESRFKAFAAYKLELNKIDKQSGYPVEIRWPTAPEE